MVNATNGAAKKNIRVVVYVDDVPVAQFANEVDAEQIDDVVAAVAAQVMEPEVS